MKNLYFLILFLFSLQSSLAQFRSTKWGDTYEQVKQKEELNLLLGELPNKSSLIYEETNISGIDFTVHYVFNNGNLERGSYHMLDGKEAHEIDDNFFEIVKLLQEKYNADDEIIYKWESNTYQDIFKDDISLAIDAGYLKLGWQKKTDDTLIRIGLLKSRKWGSEIFIVYEDLKSIDTLNKKKDEENKSKL